MAPRPWHPGDLAIRCQNCGWTIRLNWRTLGAFRKFDRSRKREQGGVLLRIDDTVRCCQKPNYWATSERKILPDETISWRKLYGPGTK